MCMFDRVSNKMGIDVTADLKSYRPLETLTFPVKKSHLLISSSPSTLLPVPKMQALMNVVPSYKFCFEEIVPLNNLNATNVQPPLVTNAGLFDEIDM